MDALLIWIFPPPAQTVSGSMFVETICDWLEYAWLAGLYIWVSQNVSKWSLVCKAFLSYASIKIAGFLWRFRGSRVTICDFCDQIFRKKICGCPWRGLMELFGTFWSKFLRKK